MFWLKYEIVIILKFILIKSHKYKKYGKKNLLLNPGAIFKKNRTIKFQFDMFHGNGVLDKAINVLDPKDRNDFRDYVNTNNSFNQGNMFITKSSKLMDLYFSDIFSWLERCEKIFGFNLVGYNKIRIYTFLAERYLSYWFKKHTKYTVLPIIFKDISDFNYKDL